MQENNPKFIKIFHTIFAVNLIEAISFRDYQSDSVYCQRIEIFVNVTNVNLKNKIEFEYYNTAEGKEAFRKDKQNIENYLLKAIL